LKYPFFSAMSAGAWVMLARKPSRTVTGEAAAAPVALLAAVALAVPAALDELELLEEQPAISSALPVTATAPAKIPRIYFPFSIS
jgi:hypothetical protein